MILHDSSESPLKGRPAINYTIEDTSFFTDVPIRPRRNMLTMEMSSAPTGHFNAETKTLTTPGLSAYKSPKPVRKKPELKLVVNNP